MENHRTFSIPDAFSKDIGISVLPAESYSQAKMYLTPKRYIGSADISVARKLFESCLKVAQKLIENCPET